MEAILRHVQFDPQGASEKLRRWQEDNLFTTVSKGDSVLIPVRDTEKQVTEHLWFEVTSTINLRWITGKCLGIPAHVSAIIRQGDQLTFRKNKIMHLISPE